METQGVACLCLGAFHNFPRAFSPARFIFFLPETDRVFGGSPECFSELIAETSFFNQLPIKG